MSHLVMDEDPGSSPVDGDVLPETDGEPQKFIVLKQDVELDVDFREKRLEGRSDIYIATLNEKVLDIAVDARQSEIDVDKITVERLVEDKLKLEDSSATYTDPYKMLRAPPYDGLRIQQSWNLTAEHHSILKLRQRQLTRVRNADLPGDRRETEGCTPVDGALQIRLRKEEPAGDRPKLIIRMSTMTADSPAANAPRQMYYKVSVPFVTKHIRDGLQFVGCDAGDTRYPHVYTRHSFEPGTASCIFPCVDDYGSRCTWKISLRMPRTLGDTVNQALATQKHKQIHKPGDADTAGKDKARRQLMMEEDKLLEMTAICSGMLTDEIVDPSDTTKKIMTFENDKKTSVQKMGFAIGPFEHVDLYSEYRTEEDDEKLGANALKIHAYCLPRRAHLVRHTCAALACAADFFSLTFCTYPYDSFKICYVDDMVDDTVPLCSFALASNRILYPEDVMDTEIKVTRSLIHSLASQWSGCHMIANTRHDLWLVIGIAYYMTDLFMKKLCGNNEFRFGMKTRSDLLIKLDVSRPSLHNLGKFLHLGDFEYEFMALKAPLVLFILDKRLIKASGSAGLTKVISKLLLKANVDEDVLTAEAFKKSCEKNGKYKLESFWNQWVFGSGCPRFDVTQRFNKKRLCVEMTLRQQQDKAALEKREIGRDDFLRQLKEHLNGVKSGDVPNLFTGPMTIRIHEADGTPYEHIVEIREDATRAARFEIPYNTKYKRIKRTRRQKERANAGALVDIRGEQQPEEGLLYCLGDVLQGSEEMTSWELRDWDADVEKKMDQESYEWIRMDADFEWLCSMTTNLESYMYVSQLQQDRDVAAQQDSMLFLQKIPPHPLVSTILTRTLVDWRYYHGIRTMAASILPRHVKIEGMANLGLRHLMRSFRELFCKPKSDMPKPNNFADKRQYTVQKAIIMAIATVRDEQGQCPDVAKRFILDQLLFNDNEENEYSDHFYVATLLQALAKSFVPEKKAAEGNFMSMEFDDGEDDNGLLAEALEIINRYLGRDEWEQSYHNIWTVAALDAKRQLMKEEVIPLDPLDFVQYLQDETHEQVRIKAFEALIDLGVFLQRDVFRFFLAVMSTDRSPYIRHHVLKLFCSGIAAVAFGDHSREAEAAPQAEDLVLQDDERHIEDKKEKHARRENLQDALAALKKEMEGQFAGVERDMQRALETALQSPIAGRAELNTLVELCSILFDDADRFVITLRFPKRWKCSRDQQERAPFRKMVSFSSYRKMSLPPPQEPEGLATDPEPVAEIENQPNPSTEAAAAAAPPLPPPPEAPKRPVVVSRSSSIKINTSKATSAAPTPRPSISIPDPASDTTVASTPTPTPPKVGQEKKAATALPSAKAAETPASVKTLKRIRAESETEKNGTKTPAPKKAKTEAKNTVHVGGSGKKSRIVTLRTSRLGEVIPRSSPSAKIATPPTGPAQPKPARKPLPSFAPAHGSSPPPTPQPKPKPQVSQRAATPAGNVAPSPGEQAGGAGSPPVAKKIKIMVKKPAEAPRP